MYENITFDVILKRMLDRVPNTMDKREGSIIYDALAPAAVELQELYLQFDQLLRDTFAATASREYLIKRVAERGIIPYPASKASLKAESTPATLDIAIGTRLSLNDLNYVVTSKIQDGEYIVMCEEAGEVGNKYFGTMIPIDYIDGLESIEITELLIPGEDEESDESIRARYFDTFDVRAYGGNVTDYIVKTNAIGGVGSTKVTPVWHGGGTVLVTILDSTYSKATDTLVQTVQNELDNIAPIGHTVTVRTVDEVDINIDTHITFRVGYDWDSLKNTITDVVNDYLLEIRTEWANEDESAVRINQIESRILNVQGVIDVSNTTINGESSNLILDAYTIPVLGGITNA